MTQKNGYFYNLSSLRRETEPDLPLLADHSWGGRIVSVLEDGFDLTAVEAQMKALARMRPPSTPVPSTKKIVW